MNTDSAGQVPGKKKVIEKEPVRILYDLIGLLMRHEQKAKCKLRMPSNIPAIYGPATGDDPLVVLEVKNQSDMHCLRMMRDCLHKNILNARVLMKKDPYLLVLVEEYTGVLLTYLKTTEPYIPLLAKMSEPRMIPSPKLQRVVSQILAGLFNLWQHNKYHGNFKLKTTSYLRTVDGNTIVKLTCFKNHQGTKSVSHYQAEDARSFGKGLTEIVEIAKEFNKQGYSLDCIQLEHLAQRLEHVSSGDLYYAMEEIKTYPFFWTYVETKLFFVSRVPLALDSNFVRAAIEGEQNLCTLPWDINSYNGYLQLMINYRKKKNKPPYDFNSRVNYVQFISGLYTHEVELQHPYADVDTTVKLSNPRLCVVLFSLLPPAQRPVNED
ncbi:unnamed protein product [Alopecurus aequalis]